MDAHISKRNYSTEVKKYNTVKETVANEKEIQTSSQNTKQCELDEKVVNNIYIVENETNLITGDARKGNDTS